MDFRRSLSCESDDEKLLALHCCDERSFVVVVDACYFRPVWELAAAAFAGYGCYGVFARFEKFGSEVPTDAASSLVTVNIRF